MVTLAAIIDYLERFAPSRLAAEWDNVGLLLGERTASVSRLMTCLTVTPESAAEAIERKANLIVSHHPILFKAVKRLTSDNPEGRMLLDLARASVAVYSPHTSFDNTTFGINELLARQLGLNELSPLRRAAGPRQVKLIVFVPEADLTRVQDAIFTAGAGHIGEYSECSYRLMGTGTFFGSDSANPTVGKKGRREEVAEWRLEVVCEESRLAEVVAAMRGAHSYEEPAFDLYPLMTAPSPKVGEGRVGTLSEAIFLESFAIQVKQSLRCGPIQVIGDLARQVKRVAIVCGAGGEFLSDAIRARADVFLTGEMRFHDHLAARAKGIALLLPGHHATERPGVDDLARRLKSQWPDLDVWASDKEVDPVTWV